MIGKKEFQRAYLSFQRKFALMMVIIEGSNEVDFVPIFKYEMKRAAIKKSENNVVIQLEMESEELGGQEVTIFFNKNSTFHGENTEDVVKREGPFFFVAEKEESFSLETTAASPVPASATKELKSDSEAGEEDLLNPTIAAGTPEIEISAKKVKQEEATALEIATMEEDEATSSSKVSGEMRGSTPDVPVESNSSPADLNLAPPPKKSKPATALPSSNLPPEVMAKVREKFASINQLMPRVEESIEEIQAVKKQFDEQLEQREKAREDLRRNVEKVMKDSEEHVAESERKKALALMLKEYMEKLIADMNRK
ncbi:Oidioi.mRNA.OKI2018_I69.XSR.g13429.t1.cds [Oikopleura dioica]|uniref:Oidioi.mRNA.OKI2018_I69.XSR.g13429.t1.cds n=1 Tax=Oikopleura dioica TaxID=34765 RepID=A0ABN7S8J3_OIKDI|nr:Oidioi.mRNA.OKI2018_I69.XSR.g13429.t1.cds [Oikopleura dioica]